MKTSLRPLAQTATSILMLTALAACASGPRGPSNAVIARALVSAPGAAQPSTIVSTELAFARDAQERGQFTAGTDFAAPGALIHGSNGPVAYAAVVSALQASGISSDWETRAVVMSCDGEMALSQGRFVDQDGFVGNYVTTWVRQSDGAYKWTYDVAGRDDPQPPPRAQIEDGDIVVTSIDSIAGLVATCPRRDESVPPPPAIPIGEDGATDAQLSRDGTLRWRWEHRAGGVKYVTAEYFYEGQWLTAIEESLASPLASSAEE
jgi:hypothetical protein